MEGFGGRSPLLLFFSFLEWCFSHFRVRSLIYIGGMWTVYILKCCDGKYYVGCTNDLVDRLLRHNRKEVSFTSGRLPVELVTYLVFLDKYKAYAFEKYLKSGSGHAFMKKRFI